MVIDPHTRAIVEVGYPDSAVIQHQLGLVNEAVQAEIDKISSEPVPVFREATVRLGAIIVVAAPSLEYGWGLVPHAKALKGRETARGWTR